MAAFKIVLCAVLAVAAAVDQPTEPERVKKDVVLGAYPGAYPYAASAYPYAASAYPYAAYPYAAYDDGKYYPGKYEKPTVYAAAAPAVSYYKPAAYASQVNYVKPASYAYPYSSYPYSSYPYSSYPYSSYPYTYPVV